MTTSPQQSAVDPATATRSDELSTSTTLSYAAGSLGTGAVGTLPGLVLAYYLTDVLGVSAAIASAVVFWPKVVDVLLYPLIGALSDRHSAATGHRRTLMVVALATLPLLFLLTFAVPAGLGPAASAWWVAFFFTASSVSFSCFQVPYLAMPAELTRVPAARIRLLGVRVAVLAVAILLVGGVAPMLRDGFGGDRLGYAVMAAAVAILIFVGILWTTSVAGRRMVVAAGHSDAAFPLGHYREGFDALRSTPTFRYLVVAFLLQAAATAVMLAGAQYAATYLLEAPDALTLLFIALIAPSLLSMPLWVKLARGRGKNVAYLVATGTFIVATLTMIGQVFAPGWWIVAPVALAGIAYAGLQALPMSMLPDTIDIDEQRTGVRRSGVMSGIWTASETAAMAMGPFLFLLVLAAGSFVSSTADEMVAQPDSAVTAIALGFSLVPAVLALASLPVVLRLGRLHPEWMRA